MGKRPVGTPTTRGSERAVGGLKAKEEENNSTSSYQETPSAAAVNFGVVLEVNVPSVWCSVYSPAHNWVDIGMFRRDSEAGPYSV